MKTLRVLVALLIFTLFLQASVGAAAPALRPVLDTPSGPVMGIALGYPARPPRQREIPQNRFPVDHL